MNYLQPTTKLRRTRIATMLKNMPNILQTISVALTEGHALLTKEHALLTEGHKNISLIP